MIYSVMKSTKQYIWEIIPKNIPLIKKICNKCGHSHYYCSEKFRINAQKKSLDVWLIYRCEQCDNTFNAEVLSRVKSGKIDADLFERLSNNDPDTVWQYAFDTEVIRRNDLEQDNTRFEYDVIHENITLKKLSTMDADIITFKIKTAYNLDLKLSRVVRQCFGISVNILKKLSDTGIFIMNAETVLKKCKIRDGVTVVVDRERLAGFIGRVIH